MTLQEAIITRRSIRKFLDKPISDNIINELLKAAQLAPSGGNCQNHIFGIIRDTNSKQALAKAAGNQMWIADAPVIIACCASLETDFKLLPSDDFGLEVNKLRFGEKLLKYIEEYESWNDIAVLLANAAPLIPAEHIFLTAVSFGLSACFIGWLDIKTTNKILNLPADISCLYLLPIGYPKEMPAKKELKNISEISFWEKYDK